MPILQSRKLRIRTLILSPEGTQLIVMQPGCLAPALASPACKMGMVNCHPQLTRTMVTESPSKLSVGTTCFNGHLNSRMDFCSLVPLNQPHGWDFFTAAVMPGEQSPRGPTTRRGVWMADYDLPSLLCPGTALSPFHTGSHLHFTASL